MKQVMLNVVALVLFSAVTACAAGNPVSKEIEGALENFAEGCEQELSTYCQEVTPGEGRVLACLYAFGDKLSSRCEHALYDSMGSLNRTLTNLSYATDECEDDMIALCSETVMGEGRVLECLKQNKGKVSSRCLAALQDVGWVDK